MRKLLLVAVVLFTLSGIVVAKDAAVTACTADRKTVSLEVTFDDEALLTHPIEAHVRNAFVKAAKSLPANRFVGPDGYEAFLANLDEADYEGTWTEGPPVVISNTCKE